MPSKNSLIARKNARVIASPPRPATEAKKLATHDAQAYINARVKRVGTEVAKRGGL